jgi:hypothetical protein
LNYKGLANTKNSIGGERGGGLYHIEKGSIKTTHSFIMIPLGNRKQRDRENDKSEREKKEKYVKERVK